VRSALDLDGITNLETNTADRECTFTVDHDKIDINAKLKELDASNKHVAGWSLLELKDGEAPAIE